MSPSPYISAYSNPLPALPNSYTLSTPSSGLYVLTNDQTGAQTNGSEPGALINTAFTALSGGGVIFIKRGTYTFTTSPAFNAAGQQLVGEGRSTILQFDGGTLTPFIKMTDTTVRAYCSVRNLQITSSTANSGLAINWDYFTLGTLEDLILDSINQGIDISNGNSFYNYIKNIRIIAGGASGFGMRLNKNEQTVMRTRISANTDAHITGVIVNAHGTSLYSVDVEGGANDPLIGIDIQASGHDTLISDCYLEANDTNLQLASGVKSVNIVGGFIADGDTANITDNGATSPMYYGPRVGNTTYNPYVLMTTLVGSETNTTPVAGANDTTIGATTRKYSHFTLPTTEPFYVITGIEWLNGTVVSGTTFCGIEQVNANPPTLQQVNILAWSRAVSQSGASAVQRNSAISSLQIPGGTICGAYIATNDATARYGTTTVASANKQKALSGTPVLADTTAWTATTEEPYIKVYYKPVFGNQ